MSLSLAHTPRYAPVRGNDHDGWSDNYGAFHIAADYAGLKFSDAYAVRSVWQHGAMGPWEQVNPLNIQFFAKFAGGFSPFVARQDEVDYLREAGFTKARAIGLPFAYVPPSRLPRQPGTLLIVPVHTLTGASFSDRAPFRAYVASVVAHAKHFSRVVACVHPSCIQNGLWVDEFKAHGIEIIEGAAVHDRGALHRMRALFDQFECVTTNGWGSHVPYALACGARVSVFGPEVESPEDARKNAQLDLAWRGRIDIFSTLRGGEPAARLAAAIAPFRRLPHEGIADIAWGERYIGADNRLPPAALRELLPSMIDAEFTSADPALPAPARSPRILFVFHEASLTGAPINLLHFLRWLRSHTTANFDILIGQSGPLHTELIKLAPVFEAPGLAALLGLGRPYDLIYANTLCCGELVRALLPLGARVVTHIHELDSCYTYLAPHGVARILRQSHSFIACSDFVRDRAALITSLSPDHFSVHPEIGDAPRARERAAAQEDSCRQILGKIPADALVIGVCGTADLRKGTDLFVQLAGLLHRRWRGSRPLRFLWIGRTKGEVFDITVENDLRRVLPPDLFIWAGEHANCLPLVARLDVFCLTSREDPYPLAMLEAASLGRPIVAFRQSGGGEDFCDRGGGTAVDFLDVAAFADAVLAFLNDEKLRLSTGRKAARLVEERHSLDTLAPALWKHLEELLSRPVPAIDFSARFKSWSAVSARGGAPFFAQVEPIIDLVSQADALLRSGKTAAAIPVVIKAAQTALKYRDLPGILASLGLVADTLDRIDAKQAKMIRDQAETIARNNKVAHTTFLI